MGDAYASTGMSDRKASPKGGMTQAMSAPGRDVIWGVKRDSHFAWTLPGGLKPKDLIGLPWRVAFALQTEGWWLRSDIIWSKPNSKPESVRDRPTRAHEYLFLLSKSGRYFYDGDALRKPGREHSGQAGTFIRNGLASEHIIPGQSAAEHRPRTDRVPAGANARTVWQIATRGYPGAHFATFPEELPCRCNPGRNQRARRLWQVQVTVGAGGGAQ